MDWHVQPIAATPADAMFDCGEPSLNVFFHRYARINDTLGIGRTYVALEAQSGRVAGYFTISMGAVKSDALPEAARKRLPRYPIPTAHIGRLAVDAGFQGRGLGKLLLVEALSKALAASESVGVYAVDVVALHDRAKAFYLKYGFLEMLDEPLHLFMPLGTIRRVLSSA